MRPSVSFIDRVKIRGLIVAFALLLGSCAAIDGAAGRRLAKVAPPADLVRAMQLRVGNDFQLGAYPEHAKSIEEIYEFLARSHSVRAMLGKWERAYAAEFAVAFEGKSGILYVYASNREFIGDIVYALSTPYPVYPRQIYVYRNRVRD